MNEEEINILIAEHCGWKHIVVDKYFGAFGMPPTPVHALIETREVLEDMEDTQVPDYCHDLNKMNEAEITLTDDQYYNFTHYLSEISWRVFPDQLSDAAYNNRLRCNFSASAIHRAEAFLKSINKWKY